MNESKKAIFRYKSKIFVLIYYLCIFIILTCFVFSYNTISRDIASLIQSPTLPHMYLDPDDID